MIFNFYNNWHVRLLLSLLQMGWDSVEASGLLAPPVHEPLPPVLIQTCPGDSVVPTGAAEAMARAMLRSALTGNQRTVFGVPIASEQGAQNPVFLTKIRRGIQQPTVDNTLLAAIT